MGSDRSANLNGSAGLLILALVATVAASASETRPQTVVLDGVEWSLETNGAYIPWPEAIDYCRELERAGHVDWRLPSLSELEGLYDAEAEFSIREPFRTDACCLWSGESLVDRPADDMEEIAGRPDMYHWGYMFDGAQRYYAVHIFEDGQALCARNAD
jgi:hypothetical protein